MRLTRILIAFAAPALIATAAASSGPASAATNECASSVATHGGVTGNYCGSQDLGGLALTLAVPNKAVAYAQVTVKATSTTNPAEDFEWFNPVSHPDNQKLAEYAPRGVPSGLYLTLSNNHHRLVLKPWKGTAAQQFTAEGPDAAGGYQWTSELTGQAITDPGNGPAYTRIIMSSPVDAAGQSFSFSQ